MSDEGATCRVRFTVVVVEECGLRSLQWLVHKASPKGPGSYLFGALLRSTLSLQSMLNFVLFSSCCEIWENNNDSLSYRKHTISHRIEPNSSVLVH